VLVTGPVTAPEPEPSLVLLVLPVPEPLPLVELPVDDVPDPDDDPVVESHAVLGTAEVEFDEVLVGAVAVVGAVLEVLVDVELVSLVEVVEPDVVQLPLPSVPAVAVLLAAVVEDVDLEWCFSAPLPVLAAGSVLDLTGRVCVAVVGELAFPLKVALGLVPMISCCGSVAAWMALTPVGGASGRACLCLADADRVWVAWPGVGRIVCWIPTAPPAVATAATISVARWLALTAIPPVEAAVPPPPSSAAPPPAPPAAPPPPEKPRSFAKTPSGPIVGATAAS
jgi:hypothetical protein